MGPAAFLLGVLAAPALGQINGVPASVTSLGGNKTFANPPGIPASVTSLGPNGFTGVATCCFQPLFPLNPNPPMNQPGFRHHPHGPIFGFGVPVYTVPYTPVIVVQPSDNVVSDDEEDGGGPTIFDRRGPRRRDDRTYEQRAYERGYLDAHEISHIRREARVDSRQREDVVREESREPAPAETRPEPVVQQIQINDQPKTALVFRDGHREEVQNYAILGDQLIDLTTVRRKIAIDALDVAATVKANDERGIDFTLPVRSNNSTSN